MAIPVEVPKLGNTVEECLIGKWLKHKGDQVSTGEVVVEIETDKANFEVTAPVDGIVLDTFFDEGALVPVFANIFVIGSPGENAEPFRPQGIATPASTPIAAPVAPKAESQSAGPVTAATAGSFSPRARRFAEEHNFHPTAVTGSGPGGRVLEEDLRRLYYSSPRVSSLAKKRIQEGMEAGEGSGPAGMVLSSDLVAPATSSASAFDSPATRMSGIREKIARRMRESLSSTAQYTLHTSANAAGLLRLRAKIKGAASVPDININDLVTFCVIQALLENRDLNVEFIDGRIYKHSEIHIGFACDTPRGLLVPVVRNAQTLTAQELSQAMKELTAQTLQGTISVDNLSGATFTVSNLGALSSFIATESSWAVSV